MGAIQLPNVPTFKPWISTTTSATTVTLESTSSSTSSSETSVLSLVVTEAPKMINALLTTASSILTETNIHDGPAPLPSNVTESPFMPDYTDTSDIHSSPAPFKTTTTTIMPTTVPQNNCVELTDFDVFCQTVRN